MHTTRQKRPDRVICKWGKFTVGLTETSDVVMNDKTSTDIFSIPLSEIPNLIKALLEIQK